MKITLTKENGSWIANYSGEGSEVIVELFGSNKIPTAYFDTFPAFDVQIDIQLRNPEAEVVVA